MLDSIQGIVSNVIDGDTFDLKITFSSPLNQYQYEPYERIRISGINTPELRQNGGTLAKLLLSSTLYGKKVQCRIQARDDYGRLVADYSVIS